MLTWTESLLDTCGTSHSHINKPVFMLLFFQVFKDFQGSVCRLAQLKGATGIKTTSLNFHVNFVKLASPAAL